MALPITMYGSTDCEDTTAIREHLQKGGIPFRGVNIDHDPEAERFVIFINSGNRTTQTLVFGDGRHKLILSEPTEAEVDELLPARTDA